MLVLIRRISTTSHFQIAAVPSLGGGQYDGEVCLLTHNIQSKIVTMHQEREQRARSTSQEIHKVYLKQAFTRY